MAISADGYIAGPNDETPWSDEEWEAYQAFVLTCDCVLLGRRTYEIMSRDDDFTAGVPYMVVSDDTSFDTGDFPRISIHKRADLPEFDIIGVIGGGELNGRMMELGLIDEIILDVEPVTLGGGTKLFGKHDIPLKLKPLSSRELNKETVQRHYQVIHETPDNP